ncbi:apolipoprotein N-acyltransferase [candidate division GN15 bacterium]|nr:apolipoprotein N-acyltransferase [candidate division GN15 bacterium]
MRKRRLELMIWAFLLSLSFYPGWFGFLAWIALVRPIIIFSRLDRRSAFTSGYFFGFFFNLFSLYWVALVTPPGMLAAVVIVAFYYTIVLVIFNHLYRWRATIGLIALPFLWVGMEYWRTLTEFAFPWSDLGYSQAYYLVILQIVSVISVHGLTLLIVAVNVLLALVLQASLSPERRLTAGFAALAVIVGLSAYGWIVMPAYPLPGTYNVTLLQGSVPLDVKWARELRERNYVIYDSLAQTVADSATNLYIWPETSAPCYVSHDAYCRQRLGGIAVRSNTPHLVGALRAAPIDGEQRHFNAAYQFGPDGRVTGEYSKIKLVPFSEQSPYQDQLPFLRQKVLREYLTFIETYDVQWWSDFYPGDSIHLFQLPDTEYGVLICFECAFPEYTRKMINRGARFLVGITNDTWFGQSVGIYMHARIFITRAVENRIWMARAANSGLTFIVDGYGRIRQELPLDAVDALPGSVNLLSGRSVYTRYGDVAGLASFLILVSTIGILVIIWLLQKIGIYSQSR